MNHNLIKQEYNSLEKSENYEKFDNINNSFLDLKNENDPKSKISELKEKIIYYMEKYITCHKESTKNYLNSTATANKISFSFEKDNKVFEDKDNFDLNKENYFNKNNNDEDILYYHFFRNYDHIMIGTDNDLRKETNELFPSSNSVNLKVENNQFNSILNDNNSSFYIKKDYETDYNFNFRDQFTKTENNFISHDPILNSNSNAANQDERFSESEVKICKEFYDTIRLKYEVFKQKNVQNISPDLGGKLKMPKLLAPPANSSDSFSSKKRNKYLMCSEDLKELCISKVKDSGEDPRIVAKEYNVPLKSLKRWLDVGSIRKKGGGRKIKDPIMEKKLYSWYIDYHDKNKKPVTAKLIKQKALEFTDRKDFHASKGWLEKYKKKYNLYISKESELKNKEKNQI